MPKLNTKNLILLLLTTLAKSEVNVEKITESNNEYNPLASLIVNENSTGSVIRELITAGAGQTRVKRQYGYGYPNPYGYYDRRYEPAYPVLLPVIVGAGLGGVGGLGLGRGRGYGGRGHGGAGGFGGRGIGGRGIGGLGGRGIGGFGGGRGGGGGGGRG